MEELFRATNNGDVAAIEDLVKNQGVDINGTSPQGYTFLMHAVLSKKRNSFDKLLELGVDVNLPSRQNKSTALMFACSLEDDEGDYFIEKLVEKGADVNIQNASGLTALMMAYDEDATIDAIEMILSANPNLELEDINKETVLFHVIRKAQRSDYDEWIGDLYKDGRTANINHQNNKGYTPLHLAVSLDEPDADAVEVVRYLMKIPGINPNLQENRGNTPLMMCVLEDKSLDILSELTNVTDIEIKNKANNTALLLSIAPRINTSYAEMLMDAGANVNVQNNDGDTPLMLAIRNDFNMDIIEILIEKGADVNHKNLQKDTPLFEAVYSSSYEADLCEILIEKGADVNALNEDDITPLLVASNNGLLDQVRVFIENGANVNFQSQGGDTALLNACLQGDIEIARLLLEKGANPNIQDVNSQTPLMFAVNHTVELVTLLLEKGADKNIKDEEDKTALDYATEYQKEEIIALLSGTGLEMWKGYTKADAEFFNPILDNPSNLDNHTICPFCLQYGVRGTSCKYMYHTCRRELRHERLYQLYKIRGGDVAWCAVCGRHCDEHGHYPLTDTQETTRPGLMPFKPGADVYDAKSCPLEGGGGPDEKIKRIDGLLRYICEVQEDVGKRSAKKVREELIEEAWKAASSRAPKTVREIRAAKKFNIPCGLPSTSGADSEETVDVMPNPNPLPIPHENAECIVELGIHEDGRPVYEFQHVQPDGTIFNHRSEYVCAQDLEDVLRNAGGMEDKCPLDLENCKGKLHPDELKAIYGQDSEVYKQYRRRFNLKNVAPTGGIRKQSRRRTYRNKKFRGGADGTPIMSRMDDPQCLLVKKTAGRRTYKKKSKSKRSTRRR